jgi:hypothetical protein
MSKELKVEINIADYLDYETLKNLATDIFKSNISRLMYSECDAKRILVNSAYDIVSDILEKRHGINLESDLEKKCLDIINDENSVKYELFRNSDYNGQKGIGLVLLEKIVTEKLQDKLEKVAENIVKNIKLDTKKFEKLVAEKVAEVVAKKLNK